MANHGNRNRPLPDLTIEPPKEPTPAELCPPGEDHNEFDEISITDRDRILLKRRFWRGRVIEFAMMQQRLVGASWTEVVRADTCHGEVHMHLLDAEGEEVRRISVSAITDALSVEEGYDLCSDRIFGHWEANVKRWADVRA